MVISAKFARRHHPTYLAGLVACGAKLREAEARSVGRQVVSVVQRDARVEGVTRHLWAVLHEKPHADGRAPDFPLPPSRHCALQVTPAVRVAVFGRRKVGQKGDAVVTRAALGGQVPLVRAICDAINVDGAAPGAMAVLVGVEGISRYSKGAGCDKASAQKCSAGLKLQAVASLPSGCTHLDHGSELSGGALSRYSCLL